MSKRLSADPAPLSVRPPSWCLGVVVPAKDEAATLPDCLGAMEQAARQVDVDVYIVVVLDACTDSSLEAVESFRATLAPELAERVRVDAVVVEVSNVGAARAAGVRHLIKRFAIAGLWVASTDADSRVPTHWLAAQLAYAQAGADAVAGTVTVTDWGDRSSAVIAQAQADYRAHPARRDAAQQHGQGHRHVHAANLGVSAQAYMAVGGYRPLLEHEDVALVQALLSAGWVVVWAEDIAVSTSARRHARTPGGFAGYLNDLEHPTLSLASIDRRTPAHSTRKTASNPCASISAASPMATG